MTYPTTIDSAREAADPATDPARLAELAQQHPELRTTIAANPACYDGLRDWIAQVAEPTAAVVDAADASFATTPQPTSTRWQEPTRATPLRWGTYGVRYAISLAAAVIVLTAPPLTALALSTMYGLGLYSAISTVSIVALLVPIVAFVAGTIVHPTSGLARGLTAIPFALWAFSSYLGVGSFYSPLFLITPLLLVVTWLIVRRRPGRSYLTLIAAAAAGLLMFLPYQLIEWTTALSTLAVVGVVWLARLLATTAPPPRAPITAEERAAAEHAARVEHIRVWEKAYADSHDGALPPAGFVPPAAAPSAGGTNMMAVLALVFGIGGGLLGIVFGHMARAQIRRTAEAGWGLATAGLIFGYLGIAIGIVIAIAYVLIVIL